MYYVVIGRSKDGTEGYGIKVESIKVLPGGQIYYIDVAGIGRYTDIDSLILNPEVIRECTPALHKIKLEG